MTTTQELVFAAIRRTLGEDDLALVQDPRTPDTGTVYAVENQSLAPVGEALDYRFRRRSWYFTREDETAPLFGYTRLGDADTGGHTWAALPPDKTLDQVALLLSGNSIHTGTEEA